MEDADLAALKTKRGTAQALFNKRAKKLTLTVDVLEKRTLIDEIRALGGDFERVHDICHDYLAALEDGGAEVEKAQAEEKTMKCLATYTETLQLAKGALWSKFAYVDLKLHADGAEEKCAELESADLAKLSEEDCQLLRENLEVRIHKLERKVLEWEHFVSGPKMEVYQQQLYKLETRLCDWVQSCQTSKQTVKVKVMEEKDCSGNGELDEKPTDAGTQPQVPSVTPVPSTPVNQPQSISPGMYPGALGFRPQISLERTRLPTFSGDMTDYYRWKAEWGELEQLGNPQRTAGVTRFHLLASLSDKVKKDLVLSSCASADEMFRRLDNRFGNKAKIVLRISEEVHGLPSVKGNNPRKAIELIQAVEQALGNLVLLGEEDVIRNRWIAQSLESKLPSFLKVQWIAHKSGPTSRFTPQTHFDCLLQFLKKQEQILEELDQLEAGEGISSEKSFADRPERGVKKAFSKATSGQRRSPLKPRFDSCTACLDETHAGRLFACKTFREMDLQRRETHLKIHGVCNRCLCNHPKDGCGNTRFLCTKMDCRIEEPHHYLLCPKSIMQKEDAGSKEQGVQRMESKGLGLTSKQEELLAKVTPELRAEFRQAFSNKATSMVCTAGDGPREFPVLMMLLEVTTNSGQLIGTLIDLASDTNYITSSAAKRLGLIGENVKLIVHGIGGMERTVTTKRYSLRVRVKTIKRTVTDHKLTCYGLDNIAEISQHVTPEQLQKIFPGVAAEELVRPENIDLLISHREGRLVPEPLKKEGDLVLWDGPLGKTVGGTHPDLFEMVDLTPLQSKTHVARSMRSSAKGYEEVLVDTKDEDDFARMEEVTCCSTTATKEVSEWCELDSIGQGVSKCGSCNCSKCPPVGKEMTERVEEILKVGHSALESLVPTGQSGRSEDPTDSSNVRSTEKILSNQMRDEENEALGLGYRPESDTLRVITSANFSKKRGKMKTGLDLQEEKIRSAPNPLTRHILLSQIRFDRNKPLTSVTEEMGGLRRKAAGAQPRKWLSPNRVAPMRLVDPRRFSSLARLCETIVWMSRAVGIWLGGNSQTPVCSKWEASPHQLVEDVAAKNGTKWKWDFHPARGELHTRFHQAANLTNKRYSDARAQEPEDSVEYSTPNSLILGRASLGGDTSGLDLQIHPWCRLRAIQIEVDWFLGKWREMDGANLFDQHAWHRTERNIRVGNLVWIADPNALRGQFRLGRILTVYPDHKGIVRDADITTCTGLPVSLAGGQKKRSSSLPRAVIRRDVRRLVVLLPVEDDQTHHPQPP